MPEESDNSQHTLTHWTHSVWSIYCEERFRRRLGHVSQLQTHWIQCRLAVSTTTTSSAGVGHIPRLWSSTEWLHCWTMGTRCSGLPWGKPTVWSLLPGCDAWTVHIYSVRDEQEGYEDVLWQHAEEKNHRFGFPKHPNRGCCSEDRG